MNQDIHVLIEHLRGQVADISYVMLAAARVLAQGTGGSVTAVLLGHNAQGLAADLAADRVLYVDHPALAEFTSDAYLKALAGLVQEHAPRAMLFGDTSIGAEVAGMLSARLGFPLVSHCRSVRVDDGALKFVSQICGGKIMAEGDLPGPTALVTVVPGGFKPEEGQSTQPPEVTPVAAPALEELHVALTEYIEPEAGDVDISKEPILVAVGRGIQNQDNIGLAEKLAEALGGVVCSSRPLVDQGWMPSTRLVGKSGKKVKPKVYLAMGISGAPEHVEGIADSDVIIAINTDPSAPIFDIAQYGAEADVLDLLPVLTERVQQAKAG
ncbi:MAG TPA: electron transfer flavoprotein subunit alpha/FixB family protein [Anaerolineae bacterium]|nr:electron transfer flavoprotein subunit alpha/FixB family protein [Anaerolineae bacterium]HIQ04204.1 electron transfer flavoprotein subunit alpha/FixB family protein [Anaerolineae bacterium]